jgi:hypothetical protein
MHLVLQVRVEDALRAETETDMDRTLRQLREEARIPGATGRRTGVTTFEILGVPEDADEAVDDVADDYLGDLELAPPGRRLVFEMRDAYAARGPAHGGGAGPPDDHNRVDAFGVSRAGDHHPAGQGADRRPASGRRRPGARQGADPEHLLPGVPPGRVPDRRRRGPRASRRSWPITAAACRQTVEVLTEEIADA